MRILIAIIVAILTAILGVGHPVEEVSVTPIEPVVKAETAVVEESGNLVAAAPETDPPLTERPEETPIAEDVVPTAEILPEALAEPEITVQPTEVPATPEPSFIPPESVELNTIADMEDADEIQEETDRSASFHIEPEMYVEEISGQIDEPLPQINLVGDDMGLPPVIVGEIIVEDASTDEVDINPVEADSEDNAPVHIAVALNTSAVLN